MWERLQPRRTSPQLTVFAPAAVIATDSFRLGIVFRLAGDAQTHAGNRVATGFGNCLITCFAVAQALATRQVVTGALDSILDSRVDLILYRPVFCKSASHRTQL